jgi:3'(2'), 5'-bisphosphate nucleotidase
MTGEYSGLLASLAELAGAAGRRILDIAPGDLLARSKGDQTPVTLADEASEETLREGLHRILPGVPIVGEEGFAAGHRPSHDGEFILVDPLDGTREFLAGMKEYAINIALVREGVPKAGVIYAPATGTIYGGADQRAWRGTLPPGGAFDPAKVAAIHTRPRPVRLCVAVSRSYPDLETDKFIAALDVECRLVMGSALKFAAVAEGRADVYPRLAQLSEWDVAAGHALVVAAGGSVLAPDGGALHYGTRPENFRLDGFVAWGEPSPA